MMEPHQLAVASFVCSSCKDLATLEYRGSQYPTDKDAIEWNDVLRELVDELEKAGGKPCPCGGKYHCVKA